MLPEEEHPTDVERRGCQDQSQKRIPFAKRFSLNWRGWLLLPITAVVGIILLLLLAAWSLPYFWLYPERHLTLVDIEGTEVEKAEILAYRTYRRKTSLWARLAEKLRLRRFDAPPAIKPSDA